MDVRQCISASKHQDTVESTEGPLRAGTKVEVGSGLTSLAAPQVGRLAGGNSGLAPGAKWRRPVDYAMHVSALRMHRGRCAELHRWLTATLPSDVVPVEHLVYIDLRLLGAVATL